MLHGFDASSVQGELPWSALKNAGYRFVILKAQQGNDGLDPSFSLNVKGALAIGMEPFAYCFAYPLPHLDPKDQARTFVQLAGGVLPGRPIFVDAEWPAPEHWAKWKCNAKQIASWLGALCEEMERLGATVVLYTYPYWWRALMDGGADVSWAEKYALWIASYVKKRPTDSDAPDCSYTFGKGVKLPPPFKTWLFWQWDGNDGLRMPNGVDADFCTFNGDEATLRALVLSAPTSRPAVDLNTIRGLQARLQALGFDPGPIDGVKGPKTLAAVKAFQRARGLTPDGVVGPLTRAALTS